MNITKDVYRKVLGALREGPKTSEEIFRECNFLDIDHCSSTISVLVRHGYIAKGYRLTEAGRRTIAGPTDSETAETSDMVDHGPVPPIPRPASPGFEWFFDEQKWEWVQRRKRGFEVVRSPGERYSDLLFG